MRCDFSTEKFHGTLELAKAVHSILDADPAVETRSRELGKYGVVVVESPTDLAMVQTGGVALGILLARQVLERSAGEVSIRGMHGLDARLGHDLGLEPSAVHRFHDRPSFPPEQARSAGSENDFKDRVFAAPEEGRCPLKARIFCRARNALISPED